MFIQITRLKLNCVRPSSLLRRHDRTARAERLMVLAVIRDHLNVYVARKDPSFASGFLHRDAGLNVSRLEAPPNSDGIADSAHPVDRLRAPRN